MPNAETRWMATAEALSLEWVEDQAEAQATPSTPAAKPRRGGDPAVLRLLGKEALTELAGQISTGRELLRRESERRRDTVATGVPPLDRLLDGGLPKGELVELVGCSGSGRFAAVLTCLATATRSGEVAVLVDLGDHLTPAAALHAGIDLERLLWLRPETTSDALAAAEVALNGGFPRVVLDLGTPPVVGGRGTEGAWMRLARAAQDHGATLLVASPYRVSGTTAHSVVKARRGRAVYAPAYEPTHAPMAAARSADRGAPPPPLVAGLGSRWELEKARGRRAGEGQAVRLALPGSFPAPRKADTPQPRRPRKPAHRGRRPAVARPTEVHEVQAVQGTHGRTGATQGWPSPSPVSSSPDPTSPIGPTPVPPIPNHPTAAIDPEAATSPASA